MKPVVTPTLANFEVGRKLSHNVAVGIARCLMNQLHAIFVPKANKQHEGMWHLKSLRAVEISYLDVSASPEDNSKKTER